MSFLGHALHILLVTLLALAPVLVAASYTQSETIGIDSSSVLFSSGWSTVSNAAGTFTEASGKADEVEIFPPTGTVSMSYVGFKRTGGALYAVCLDCGTSGQQLMQINASDPNADTSTPVVLFSFTSLDPTTSHHLQVVNSADPAFGDTSELTFKELNIQVDTTATTSSSSIEISSTSASSTSRTTSTTTSSTSSSVSTSTTSLTTSTSTSTTSTSTSTSTTSTSTSTSTTSTSTSTTLTSTSTTSTSTSTTSTSTTTSSTTTSTSTTTTTTTTTTTGLSTGTIVAAAVSSAAAVLLLLALAIFLLYRARNRQLRADSESIASGSGLTRQISAPSVVSVPFEVTPSAAVSAYAAPRSATAGAFARPGPSNGVRRRSYMTGAAALGGGAAGAGAARRDDDGGSTTPVPLRPRNPYEGVVRPDVPIDYPGHPGNLPSTPRTPGTGRSRGMFR